MHDRKFDRPRCPDLVPVDQVEKTILLIRGQRVILDADLAKLYGVPTERLNQQVRRNQGRFPADFMFHLTKDEKLEVLANCKHLSGLRFSQALPLAFTEHGAIMAASVLNTQRAVEASIFVVRAFVKIREVLVAHKELALKLAELEFRVKGHDEQILAIVEAIRQLMAPSDTPGERIGFRVKERRAFFADDN
jgi:hypothetical protein